MQERKTNRYLGLAILAWGGGTVYKLAYLRYIIYDPMIKALGVNHTEFGLTMSAYGLLAMLTYFPGGWLADRFSPRKLLTLSYTTTALMGLYFSTFPSYWACMFIHAFWGVSTTLIFWAAMMRACKDLASNAEQGRFFGLLECVRGIISTLVSFTVIWIFNKYSEPLEGLRWSIIFQSTITFLAGVFTWFLFNDPPAIKSNASVGSDIMKTLKTPMVWAAAGMVFFCYGAKVFGSYANPYLTEVYLMSVAIAGTLSTIWNYGCQFLGGPLGGFIADKIGHRPKVLSILFVIMCVTFLPLVVVPADPALLFFLLITTTCCFLTIFAIRGLYFAVVSDLFIPASISGSTIGFMSLVGFTPDVFVYPIAGKILDSFPPLVGYRIIFGLSISFAFLGTILAVVVVKCVNKYRREGRVAEQPKSATSSA
jgi:predicted MFS family arabinose efflux permease